MPVYDIAAKLPPINMLRQRCRALAVLERIIDSYWPMYTYTRTWGDSEAALMTNGSGDEWAIVFTADGAFIRVFDHESLMTPYRDPDRELWPGLLDGLPAVLRHQIEEPAFADEEGHFVATAVLWRLADDDRWHAGKGITFPPSRGPYDTDPDGSGMLAIVFDDIVDRYVTLAQDYYEVEIDRAAVEYVVGHHPLTDSVVQALNPSATVTELHNDMAMIGYPVESSAEPGVPDGVDTVTLWRPTGPEELALVKASQWSAWPPRLPEQPIFYPVLNEEYATRIARDWNVRHSGVGYVTRFRIRRSFLDRYEIHQVGGPTILEYWIPAEDLEEFNANLVGTIELVAEYR